MMDVGTEISEGSGKFIELFNIYETAKNEFGAVQTCENLVVIEKIILKNAYLGAKIGFDTAANELSKVCPLSVYISPR